MRSAAGGPDLLLIDLCDVTAAPFSGIAGEAARGAGDAARGAAAAAADPRLALLADFGASFTASTRETLCGTRGRELYVFRDQKVVKHTKHHVTLDLRSSFRSRPTRCPRRRCSISP